MTAAAARVRASAGGLAPATNDAIWSSGERLEWLMGGRKGGAL